MKTRVLLIGAGRRIQNSFLPVLALLRSDYEISGILSPNLHRRAPLAAQWDIASYASLDEVDLDEIDIVVQSIPTSQNASMLNALKSRAAHLTLVIDTPIAWTRREFADCLPALRSFHRVVVAEDYMHFPAFRLARQAVADGLIGEVEWLTLSNIGFYYHGLALIRSFSDFQLVKRSTRFRISKNDHVVRYHVGALKAAVVPPYLGHTAGGLVVEGSRGRITEFSIDISKEAGDYLLEPQFTNGRLDAYRITGEEGVHSELSLPEFEELQSFDFQDKSRLNLERACGLAHIFRNLASELDGKSFERIYGYEDAIYDRLVSVLSSRGRFPVDPALAVGKSIMSPYSIIAKIKG